MLGRGQDSSADRADAEEPPRTGERRYEETDEKTKAHGEEGDGSVGHCERTTDGVAFPDPEDHSARVGKEGVHAEEETSNTKSRKCCRAFGRTRGRKVSTRTCSRTGGSQHCYNSQSQASLVPTVVRSMHDRPDWIVGVESELGKTGENQTDRKSRDACLKTMSL